MKLSFTSYATVAASSLLLGGLASACNPLAASGCAADKALGRTVSVDFTQGASSEFTASYNVISYESDGVHLTVSEKGDAPLLVSNWYIMFGRYEVVFQSATGTGMVSSAIMQSDDLDEIDWELLGADPIQAQTNYFGRGVTETYDREVTVSDPGAVTGFHTYVIDWTETSTTWSIDGVVLRTLYAADADVDSSGKSEYPQSPMQIKIGPWAGGDPDNAEGTITWAGGEINYADGPYTMIVKSVSVTDYSTGTEYEYTGTSGTYKDITAVGGAVNGNANGANPGIVSSTPTSASTTASSVATSSTTSSTTSTTAAASSSFVYVSTEAESTSTINTRTIYPWVPLSTTESSASVTTTTVALTVTGSTSSSTSASTLSSSLSSSPSSSSSSVAGSTGGSTKVTTSYSTLATAVASAGQYEPASSTAALPLGDSIATSTLSSLLATYTGAASPNVVARFGAAACIAAGLVLAV